jgi:hypothetical protein
MSATDVVWAASILGGSAYLLYRSLWKRKGACSGCSAGGCAVDRKGAAQGCTPRPIGPRAGSGH